MTQIAIGIDVDGERYQLTFSGDNIAFTESDQDVATQWLYDTLGEVAVERDFYGEDE